MYAKTGLDVSGIDPVFQDIRKQQQYQNQQFGQTNSISNQGYQPSNLTGLNPLAMAAMLRGKGSVEIPQGDYAQMTNVPGMGNSMGTGLTLDQYNSGIGYDPLAQIGGYGLKP